MEKKLYVGGLPYATTEDELRTLFAECGEVTAAVIIPDREKGLPSKGFGFVTFANGADADKAIEKFNGFDLGGRKLTVNEARPRESRPAY